MDNILDTRKMPLKVPTDLEAELDSLSNRLKDIPFERKKEAVELADKMLDIMAQIVAYNVPIR